MNTSTVRAGYYLQEIQRVGKFCVNNNLTLGERCHAKLAPMDLANRPDLDRAKIRIDEKAIGFHEPVEVGIKNPGFFAGFGNHVVEVGPEYLIYRGHYRTIKEVIGRTFFTRKPKYHEVTTTLDWRTLDYASRYNPEHDFSRDTAGRTGGMFKVSVGLPQSIMDGLIPELERDFNLFHMIVYGFYYPTHGVSIVLSLIRNGSVNLETTIPEIIGDQVKRPTLTETLNYAPIGLANVRY
ncbi:MAG: hypothetical protein WC624_04855 [Candidatus Margulisiibacteriota bacterium]